MALSAGRAKVESVTWITLSIECFARDLETRGRSRATPTPRPDATASFIRLSGSMRVIVDGLASRPAKALVAGDKQGNWSGWYKAAIPLAEERYNRWLEGGYDEERT